MIKIYTIVRLRLENNHTAIVCTETDYEAAKVIAEDEAKHTAIIKSEAVYPLSVERCKRYVTAWNVVHISKVLYSVRVLESYVCID